MSDTDDDDLLGVQAFQDMAQAVTRLDGTLKATELHQRVHAEAQTRATSEAVLAARQAMAASQNALQAAQAQIRIQLAWTAAVGLGVVLVAFVGGFRFGEASGWQEGHAAGYASAISSNADASWASTPSGQRALALDRRGALSKLLDCSQPGWKVEIQKGERVCFVDKAPDGKTYGWGIP